MPFTYRQATQDFKEWFQRDLENSNVKDDDIYSLFQDSLHQFISSITVDNINDIVVSYGIGNAINPHNEQFIGELPMAYLALQIIKNEFDFFGDKS